MGWIRVHLRAVVVAWLVGQAVAASAFSLADCCAGHRATVAKACHEAPASAAPSCPMRGADGSTCPMHRTQGEHPRTDGPACTMKSTCAGPIATLATLFFVQGILPEPVSVPIRLDTPERVAAPADAPLTFVLRPESPPPRPTLLG